MADTEFEFYVENFWWRPTVKNTCYIVTQMLWYTQWYNSVPLSRIIWEKKDTETKLPCHMQYTRTFWVLSCWVKKPLVGTYLTDSQM